MARRKDHTPDELKALVLAEVLGFLQHNSADKMSLRQLAKMVGYSPGTLINLFGSYAHLILAANALTLDQISKELLTVLSTSDDPHEQLYLVANQYLSFAKSHHYQWMVLFEHHLDKDEDVPEWQLSRINGLFDLISECLLKLNPKSNIEERNKATRVIWAAVHGICLLEVDNKLFAPNDITGESMIRSLLSHYLSSWKNS